MDNPTYAVLRSIYRSQPVTRKSLSEQTGLGANRITLIVAHLLEAGILREEVAGGGLPGRPVGSLSLDVDTGRAIGLDIGGEHLRAVVTDLLGQVRASVVRPTETVADRAVILSNLRRLIDDACAQARIEPASLLALGVGLRAIVDARTGTVLDWPSAPAWASAWRGLEIPALLAAEGTQRPLMVEDSVRTMALAAHRFGAARGCDNFLYIFLGTGIGSALVLDGVPYRGGIGLAGELGHITVQEDGEWCSCGNRGCLEVLASTNAILARVRALLSETRLISRLRAPFEQGELTLQALLDAAQAGDKLAYQILDEAGLHIGRVVAVALNLLGPKLVVLGGPLVQSDGVILEAVRRQVRLRAMQSISSQTRIIADDQGEMAGAQGAALLALVRLFELPHELDRLLLAPAARR
jgi:predicted NBD/HSP70 family sugar kinase